MIVWKTFGYYSQRTAFFMDILPLNAVYVVHYNNFIVGYSWSEQTPMVVVSKALDLHEY